MSKQRPISCKSIMAFLFLIALFSVSCTPPAAQRVTQKDLLVNRPGAKDVVIVHSRSGNTAKMGLQISGILQSDYVRLQVPEGSGDSYLSSPNRNEAVSVNPQKVDLSKYRLVFLGSPIWYWHPSAFIYSFIKSNDLTAKKVVLFYTFQGGIAKDAIDEWKSLVQKSGGTVIDVLGINRNVFKTDDAFQAEVQALVDRQRPKWNADIK